MDFIEKAKIRMSHWIEHNRQHIQEYKNFAEELRKVGKTKSAQCIEEMVKYIEKSNKSLENALNALEE